MNVFRSAMLVLALGSGFTFAADKMQEFRAHFDQGKVFYAAGKYAEAAAEWEAARVLNVSEPVTQKNLALCYMKLQQYDKAEPLRRDLCEPGRAAEDCLPYAETLLALGKWVDVVQQLDQIEGGRTAVETAIESRFRCYAHIALQEYPKAVDACRGGEPDTYQPIALNLLLACLKADNTECAKETSAKLAQKSSRDWLDVGRMWLRSASDDARKEFIPEFLKSAPDLEAKKAIAAELAKKGLFDEALPLYERLAQEPGTDSCDIAEPLARAYVNAKQDDKVLQWSSAMIKCSPEVSTGYALRGIVYYRQHDWDNAIADFTKSLSIVDDASVRANLDNAKKYKSNEDQQARAADEAKAEARRAQEEYRRRVQKDLEDYCKQNPRAEECKKLPKPPPKTGR